MGKGLDAGLLGVRAESPPEAGQGGGSMRSWPHPVGSVWGLYGSVLSSYLQGHLSLPTPCFPYLNHKPGDLWKFSMDFYHHDYCCHQSQAGAKDDTKSIQLDFLKRLLSRF